MKIFNTLLSVLLCLTVYAWPQNSEIEIEALITAGEIQKANQLAVKSLQSNTYSYPEYSRIFQLFLKTEENIDRVFSFIDSELKKTSAADINFLLLKEKAVLAELSGNTEDAMQAMIKAAALNSSVKTEDLFFLAVLYIQNGENQQALKILDNIAEKSKSRTLKTKSLILGAVIRNLYSSAEAEKNLLNLKAQAFLEPETALLLYYSSMILGLNKLQRDCEKTISTKWPDSVENQIINDKISLKETAFSYIALFNVAASLTELETDNKDEKVMIQTGSFTSEINARKQSEILLKKNYKAEIIEEIIKETKYFKVIIKTESRNSQELLLKLKEDGFEAWLIF
jgi:tetratricopeptide (TPR) repeat protein